jgi:hypothetical protein
MFLICGWFIFADWWFVLSTWIKPSLHRSLLETETLTALTCEVGGVWGGFAPPTQKPKHDFFYYVISFPGEELSRKLVSPEKELSRKLVSPEKNFREN